MSKRGRPPNEEYSVDHLLGLLREFVLETEEKLTYSLLERMSTELKGTRIERRQWKKVNDHIASFNEVKISGDPKKLAEFGSPTIEDAFEQYYGKNEKKLKQICVGWNEQVHRMTAKCLAYDALKQQFEEFKLLNTEEIENLNDKLRQAKRNEEKYRLQYVRLCGENYYDENSKAKVIELRDKSSLDLACLMKDNDDIL